MPRHRPSSRPQTLPARAGAAHPAARRLPLVLLLAALVGAALATLPARPAAAQGPGTYTVLSQVNASRAAAGLRPLTLAGDLSAVAYAWSGHLAASGTLAHNPDLTGQVGNWQVLGENVGYGPTVSDVETAYMNSPHHRANILEPRYTQIGIGVVVDASGTSWVTQVFRKPLSAPAPSAGSTAGTARTATHSTARPTSHPTSYPAGTRPAQPRTAPAPARAARPAPTARPVPAAPTRPDPAQLLAQRLAAAAKAQPSAAGDPISAALGWAAAMDALAG